MDHFQQLRSAIEKEHWLDWQALFQQEDNPQQYSDQITFLAFQNYNDISGSMQSYNLNTQMGDKLKPYKLLQLPQEQNCSKEQPSENESQFDVIYSRQGRNKQRRKEKREAYPTKNFLQTFRTSFLRYLQKHFNGTEQQFKDIAIVGRIKSKKCINMQDYQDLFNYPIFRPILENYFKEKVIYRDLMVSRVEEKKKRHYFTKVHVFEEAFISRKFKKINY